jgi:hypothetical protein
MPGALAEGMPAFGQAIASLLSVGCVVRGAQENYSVTENGHHPHCNRKTVLPLAPQDRQRQN